VTEQARVESAGPGARGTPPDRREQSFIKLSGVRTMRVLTKNVVEFLKREDGPTAVEYAVMLALIIVVCIAAITAIGSASNEQFSTVGSAVKPS
jgi:pilus assembly protein Flp/PilA